MSSSVSVWLRKLSFLLVLASLAEMSHGNEVQALTCFDQLVPIAEEAGLNTGEASVGGFLALDAEHYLVIVYGPLKDSSGQWGRVPIILDKSTDNLCLSLGLLPPGEYAGVDHGDANHLVFERENGGQWIVYFDLVQKKIVVAMEGSRFGVNFLAVGASKVFAAQARPMGVLSLPKDRVPLNSGEVSYSPLPVPESQVRARTSVAQDTSYLPVHLQGSGQMLRYTFRDKTGEPVFASSNAVYRFTSADWTVEARSWPPRVDASKPGEVWRTIMSPEFESHPLRSDVVLDTGVPGMHLLRRDKEIVEVRQEGTVKHPLPPPTTREYLQYSKHARLLWHPSQSTIPWSGAIGPMLFTDKQLHFGLKVETDDERAGLGGLGKFDPRTAEMSVTYYPFMAQFSTSALARDTEGRLWIALVQNRFSRPEPGGLARLEHDGQHYTHFEIDERITCLEASGNLLYIGTESGLFVLDGEELTSIRTHPGSAGDWVSDISRQPCQGTLLKASDWRQDVNK